MNFMNKTLEKINSNIYILFYLYAISCCLSISASTIILVLFLVLWLINTKENFKKAPKDFLIFIIFYIWRMLTLVLNGIFSQFGRIINIWDKMPYFFVSNLKINKEQIIKFFQIIFWLNSIILIYALLQKYAGFPSIIKSLFTPDMERFKGYFSHPLRFAGYISIVTLLSFNFAIFYSNKFLKFIPFLYLSVLLNGSRSYIISVILTTILISYFKSKKTFVLTIISTFLYLILVIFLFPTLKNRVETTFDKNFVLNKANVESQNISPQSSASLRLNFWKAGLEIFSKSPIYGIGDGEISKYLKPYKEKGLIDNVAHAHNAYITAAAESGIIGLGIYLWLLIYFIRKYFKLANYSQDLFEKAFAFGLFSAFLNLAIAGIFESNFSTFIIWSFLTFLMGIFHSYKIFSCRRGEI